MPKRRAQRNNVIILRLTDAEYETLHDAASALLESDATFSRRAAVAEAVYHAATLPLIEDQREVQP